MIEGSGGSKDRGVGERATRDEPSAEMEMQPSFYTNGRNCRRKTSGKSAIDGVVVVEKCESQIKSWARSQTEADAEINAMTKHFFPSVLFPPAFFFLAIAATRLGGEKIAGALLAEPFSRRFPAVTSPHSAGLHQIR